jgi:hypothetical protein
LTLENREQATTTQSPSEESEEISYVETRKFHQTTCVETKRLEYPSSDAYAMYRRVIEKYRQTDEAILICLRDKDDQLVKSELLNYSRGT